MANQPTNSSSEKVEPGVFSSIRVTCPHCELVGTFQIDRLQPKTRVRCQRCDQWFRIETHGKTEKVNAPDPAIRVGVRTGSSEWTEHLAPESGRLKPRSKLLHGSWKQYVSWRSGIAAGLVLLTVACAAWRLAFNTDSEAQAADYQEPEALADRAAAFSLAWVCKDASTMSRFTAPRQSAAFGIWLRVATGQLAVTLEDVAPGEVESETLMIGPEKQPDRAIVTVGVRLRAGAAPPKDAPGYVHRQAWSEIDGKWFFLPEETFKLLKSPRTSPWQ